MKQAEFAGKCPGCGEQIREGDQIGTVEGEWVCERCVDDAGAASFDPSVLPEEDYER